MAVSLKHTTLTTESPTGPGGTITAAEWDEAHDLQMAADRLLGRTTAGTGAVEEISIGTGLSMASGVLSASGGGGGGWTQIATSGTLSGTSYAFTGIPSTYDDLYLAFEAVSHNSGSSAALQVTAGSPSLTAGWNMSSSSIAASNALYGGALLTQYANGWGTAIYGVANVSVQSTATASVSNTVVVWRLGSETLDSLTVRFSAGSFDGGTLTLYGR